MLELVLLRHGQSIWNKENRFTGWADVDLTEQGTSEAMRSGRLLAEAGYQFDVVYTSVLKRAIKMTWMVLDQLNLDWIPVQRTWRLNEKHCGSLEGLNKARTALVKGEEQVLMWDRSFETPPPPLDLHDKRYPGHDPRYAALNPKDIPVGESLQDTQKRLLPYWNKIITPALRARHRVLIVAHGDSLRALVKHIDGISDDDIVMVNIPTGLPLIYELDDGLQPTRSYYLGDRAVVPFSPSMLLMQGAD